jgi:hypothetical protein
MVKYFLLNYKRVYVAVKIVLSKKNFIKLSNRNIINHRVHVFLFT